MNAQRAGRPERPQDHATPRERFGYQLRVLRKAKGCRTQDAAAELLGCSQPTISQAERGRTLPSEPTVIAWDRALDAAGLLHALYEDVADDRERRAQQADASPPSSRYPIPGDATEWVCDVTVPDGTIMAPSELFTKIWRVRNSGSVPWVNRFIRRQGSTGAVGQIHSPRLTPIPTTDPGETVDVAVDCKAHVLPGSSIAYFKFADADGNLFFPNMYDVGIVLAIEVVAPPAP